jgi:hypothetical protein
MDILTNITDGVYDNVMSCPTKVSGSSAIQLLYDAKYITLCEYDRCMDEWRDRLDLYNSDLVSYNIESKRLEDKFKNDVIMNPEWSITFSQDERELKFKEAWHLFHISPPIYTAHDPVSLLAVADEYKRLIGERPSYMDAITFTSWLKSANSLMMVKDGHETQVTCAYIHDDNLTRILKRIETDAELIKVKTEAHQTAYSNPSTFLLYFEGIYSAIQEAIYVDNVLKGHLRDDSTFIIPTDSGELITIHTYDDYKKPPF